VAASLDSIFKSHRIIDLTLPLSEPFPCTWPGHMPFRATVWTWFEDRPDDPQPVHAQNGGAYQTRWLVIDEHTGTHLDAPRHFVAPEGSGLPSAGALGDVGVADLPLLCATGPVDVIDVTELAGRADPGCSPVILPGLISKWEDLNGKIEAGDVVCFRSRWDDHYRAGSVGEAYGTDVLVTKRSIGWPAPSAESVELLRARGVTCLGTDGLSVGAAENGAPAHLAGLPFGMTFIEALTHLDELPARGAWFMFLPLRLVAGTGGPGRALAVLPESTERTDFREETR
jgi:kynurenine formamidase